MAGPKGTAKPRKKALPRKESPVLALLVQQPDGSRKVFSIDTFPVRVGRAKANELVLEDFNASRVHAEIQCRDGKFHIRDCQSLNGLRLNGELVIEAPLLPGDRVQVGDSELHVLDAELLETTAAGGPEISVGPSGTGGLLEIIHAVSVDQLLAGRQGMAGLPEAEELAAGPDAKQYGAKLSRAYNTLLLMMNMVSGLGSSDHPEQLCEQFVTALRNAFPLMENVAVVRAIGPAAGRNTSPEVPYEVLYTDGSSDRFEQTRSSRTILGRVLREMHAVHAVDASKDPRFSESDSVRRRGIRSMMCAPLVTRGEARGAIYVENLTHPYCFTRFDLNLLTLFAFHLTTSLEVCWMAREREEAFEQAVESLRGRGEERSELVARVYQSEKKFRALFEQSSLGAAVIDLEDGEIQEVNDALVQLLGYSRRRLEGMRLRELAPGDETVRVEEWCGYVRSRGQGSCRMVLRTGGGETVVAQLNCRVLRIDDRQVMVAFFVDMTSKERMEQETQMQLRRVTVLAEFSKGLMTTRDPAGVHHLLFDKVSTVLPLDAFHVATYSNPGGDLRRSFAAVRTGPESFRTDRETRRVPGENAVLQQVISRSEPTVRQTGGASRRGARVEAIHTDPFDFPDGQFLPSAIMLPLTVGGNVEGVVCVQSLHPRVYESSHVEILSALVAQAGLGLSNAEAFRSIREQQESLSQLSVQIMTAQETERGRISRELHDGVGQQLTAMRYMLESIRSAARPSGNEKLMQRLGEAGEMAKQLIEDLRTISLDLRPTMLDDLGLEPTLQWFCEQFSRRYEIDIVLDLQGGNKPLDPNLATATYRIVQEGLGNVAKHAGATQVELSLRREKRGWLALEIRDNGIGFRAEDLPQFRASRGCSGILNMKERAHFLGGQFFLETEPGDGTILKVRIPTGEG